MEDKKIHTIITHHATYVRMFVIAVLSVLFVMVIPLFTLLAPIQEFLAKQVVNMGILYAIIAGFLLSITLRRRQSLEEYIYLELNKFRRIYHLGLHLAKHQSGLKRWFEELKRALANYQDFFYKNNFSKYGEGNALFREITYTIYKLPSLNTPYNPELYQSLLEAAAAATESREYIRATKVNSIGLFQWLVLGVVAATLGFILVGATPKDLTSTFASAVVIFNLFLVLDLLYEYDHSNTKKDRQIAKLYSGNLPELYKKTE